MSLTAKVSSTNRSASIIHGAGYVEPAFHAGNPGAAVMACALWDDRVDGHLPVGGMGLGVYLPPLANVIHNFHHLLVLPVGPSNMNLSLENDADLIADAAISGDPWSTLGATMHGVVVRTDTTAVAFTTVKTTTVVRELILSATVAVSSAGRIAFYVEYVPGPAAAQGAS